jgi:chromosome segregation ATPase
MAERGALKALDPNVKKAGKGGLGAPASKIPRAVNAARPEIDSATKQNLEAKLHEVLDEYEELRTRFGELEAENRKLTVENINMEEEAGEWKKSYESLQAEGTELFQTYERKCTMLKEVSKQLEDYKSKVAERDARLKEAQSSKDAAEQERDELREKVKANHEVVGKQESRYLALKDEHNQTLAKLDTLQQQLRDAMRAAPRADGSAHAESLVQPSTRELESLKQQLQDAGEREQKAQQEIAAMQHKLQLLAAQKPSQGPCTSPPPSSDTVGALPAITPLRTATQTPSSRGAPPKTPSGAMLEMTQMSPESLRERAESLLISNDLLRQEVNASKREREEHEETVRNLEAAVGDLKAQVDAAKKQQRCVAPRLALIPKP